MRVWKVFRTPTVTSIGNGDGSIYGQTTMQVKIILTIKHLCKAENPTIPFDARINVVRYRSLRGGK